MNTASTYSTLLLDTIERVPHLLQCICTASAQISQPAVGAKSLRLVCKAASVVAMQAVQRYSLSLSSLASSTEPLSEVAALLKYANLRQLDINIDCVNGFETWPFRCQLSSLAAQLNQFTYIIGAAWRGVQTMQIALTLSVPGSQNSIAEYLTVTSTDPCPLSCAWPSKKQRQAIPEFLSTDGGFEIVCLLAALCPNVTKLHTGGGLGERALRFLGSSWRKLTSLSIANSSILFAQLFSFPQQDFVFPRLTHLSWTCIESGQALRLFELFACPSLTSLHVQPGEFDLLEHWFVMPPHVKHLECECLPYVSNKTILSNFHLVGLETITLSSRKRVSLGIQALAAVLKAAPSLNALLQKPSTVELTDVPTSEGIAVVVDVYSAMLLPQMYAVHQRMHAGFVLHSLDLDCTDRTLPRDHMLMSMDQMLDRMPHFQNFKSLRVGIFSNQSWSMSGTLTAINRAFPQLESLGFLGPWMDADMGEKVMFNCVTSLRLSAKQLSPASITLLVASMPRLTQLHIYSNWAAPQRNIFEAWLRTTQTRNDCVLFLGDWVMRSWSVHNPTLSALIAQHGTQGTTIWQRVYGEALPLYCG